MDWRVYLDGGEPDLAYLRRELRTSELSASSDDGGTYLHGNEIARCPTADDVRDLAESLIRKLNGMAGLAWPGFRPVTFAGRIMIEESAHIYVGDAARGVDLMGVVTVVADRFVTTADGVVRESGPTPLMGRFLAVKSNPVLDEVYTILGSTPTPKWPEFYKVYELLREASGGSDYDLSKRTGVSQARLEKLTTSSNHPRLSGSDARHAVMKGEPSEKKKLSLDEGRAVVDELIQGFAANG